MPAPAIRIGSSLYDGHESMHNGTAEFPAPRQGNGDTCHAIPLMGLPDFARC
jgi:hypothetical protein